MFYLGFFAALLFFVNLFTLNLSLAKENKVFPVIYFDNKIITNIDLEIAKKIAIATNPVFQDIIKSKDPDADKIITKNISESIIENLTKAKYAKKALASQDVANFNETSIKYCKDVIASNKNLSFIKDDDAYYKYLCEFLKNDIIWSSFVSNSIARSIVVSKNEIDIFLKTHLNHSRQDAEAKIRAEKQQTQVNSLLEDTKAFTFVKNLSDNYLSEATNAI
jgi:hypothetical protein